MDERDERLGLEPLCEGEGVGASDCTSELGLSFAVDGFGFGENVVSGRELRRAKTQ